MRVVAIGSPWAYVAISGYPRVVPLSPRSEKPRPVASSVSESVGPELQLQVSNYVSSLTVSGHARFKHDARTLAPLLDRVHIRSLYLFRFTN